MQLRYGILSTSSIAPRFIAALREADAGQVVALSSRSPEKAREKAALWQIPRSYGSHKELLEDPDVDIVYISNVNTEHYPWAMAALEHGKHAVCEKPCTTTQAQTRVLFRSGSGKGPVPHGSGKNAPPSPFLCPRYHPFSAQSLQDFACYLQYI